MKIAVLGSGNGGCAVAAECALQGHDVRIFTGIGRLDTDLHVASIDPTWAVLHLRVKLARDIDYDGIMVLGRTDHSIEVSVNKFMADIGLPFHRQIVLERISRPGLKGHYIISRGLHFIQFSIHSVGIIMC